MVVFVGRLVELSPVIKEKLELLEDELEDAGLDFLFAKDDE